MVLLKRKVTSSKDNLNFLSSKSSTASPLLFYNFWILVDNTLRGFCNNMEILAGDAVIFKDYRLGPLVFRYKNVKSLDLERLMKL